MALWSYRRQAGQRGNREAAYESRVIRPEQCLSACVSTQIAGHWPINRS